MSCTFTDIKNVVSALESISQFRSVADVYLQRSGLYITCIDDKHIMLVDMNINSNDMKENTFSDDKKFHCRLKSIASTLKLGVKRGEVKLAILDNTNPSMRIELEDASFDIQSEPLDNRLSSDILEPPNHSPNASLTISSKEAKRVMKELANFECDIDVKYDKASNIFILACNGIKGNAIIKIGEASKGVERIYGDANTVQRFDRHYLNKIVKQDVGNQTITFNMRDGEPMEVRHDIGTSSHLTYYLAPKMV